VQGDPRVVLVEFSKQRKPNLIVMGRRGLNEVTGLVLGSVSDYCLQHSFVPIMIVN
jgi:nucleotide-binding universal stress UspA family protein